MTDKTRQGNEPDDRSPEQVEAFEPLPGDLLREARHRRGWTLARVAEDMNLEVRFVEAMEDNRFEALGAPVFARGHLRKYARLLELDSERLMRAYGEIERERLPAPAASVEGLNMTGDAPPGGRGWRTLAVLIVLAAVAVLAWRLLATRPDSAPPAGEPAEQGTLRDDEGYEDPIEQPVAVPLPVNISSGEGEGEGEVPAETSGEEALEPAPAQAADAEPPAAEDEPVPPAAEEEAPVTGPGVQLVLRFVADSWVEVRDANGSRLVYQLGRAGAERTVRGVPPFDIFIGFADGVTLEMDGEPVAIPPVSRLGRTARFRLPADSTAANLP